jgi:hypothetical protein
LSRYRWRCLSAHGAPEGARAVLVEDRDAIRICAFRRAIPSGPDPGEPLFDMDRTRMRVAATQSHVQRSRILCLILGQSTGTL